jgi:hypothetical protein
MNPILQTLQTDILAPFEIWEVPLDKGVIKFHEPLILTPNWMPHDPDEPGDVDYLEIVCPELNIDVYGENRDELLDAVHSMIHFAWKHYVQPNNNELNAKIKTIKHNYLTIAEEVLDA